RTGSPISRTFGPGCAAETPACPARDKSYLPGRLIAVCGPSAHVEAVPGRRMPREHADRRPDWAMPANKREISPSHTPPVGLSVGDRMPVFAAGGKSKRPCSLQLELGPRVQAGLWL